MNTKFVASVLLVLDICSLFVTGEGQLVRHNAEDDIQLMIEGGRVMPDPTCSMGMGMPDDHVRSACYLHCILLGHGAGNCAEDRNSCECYGQGPPGYYSATYTRGYNENKQIDEAIYEAAGAVYSHTKENLVQEYTIDNVDDNVESMYAEKNDGNQGMDEMVSTTNAMAENYERHIDTTTKYNTNMEENEDNTNKEDYATEMPDAETTTEM